MFRFTATMNDTGKFEVPLPKDYAFATLGPNSLIDLVDIGGTVLGPDDVIAIEATTLKRVRPLRVTGGQVDGFLELELWQACETPVPKARNPVSVRGRTAYAHATDLSRIIRLPYSGRRAGSITLIGQVGKLFDWAVYGIKYQGTRDAYIYADNGSETPTTTAAVLVGTAELVALEIMLGGLNDHDDVDEIEVWYRTTNAADVCDFIAEGYDLCR